MRTSFEIHTGRRVVSTQICSTPQEALIEYLRSLGCRDEELVRAAPDAMSWHGAVYTAVETTAAPSVRRAA